MFRLGVMMVVVGALAGCQTASSDKASSASGKSVSDWKPWVLQKYDADRDGELRGAELKAAVADDRFRNDSAAAR